MKNSINDLNQVLTYHLEGMYDAEKRLQKSIPSWTKQATSTALKNELNNYLETSTDKRLKLKRIFSYLLAGPFGRSSGSVAGVVQDTRTFLKYTSEPELKDVILLECLREINNHKISAYETSVNFSEALDLNKVTDLLLEILQWERKTEKALSRIALNSVNKRSTALSLV